MSSNVHRVKSPPFVPFPTAGSRLSRRISRTALNGGILACLLMAASSHLAAAKDYQSYDEAMADAQKSLQAKNYLASQEPLEAAIELAEDDTTRIKLYRMLFTAYRLHPDTDDMLKACEFILDHSQSSAEKSLTRSNLMRFIGERGKADEMIEYFEKRLEQDENDRTALFVLSEACSRLKQDPEKSANFTERLAKVIEASGEKVDVITYASLAALYVKSKKYQQGAELYEKIAPDDESLAAWNWKEAAAAWLKADEREKALTAAMNSTKLGPETRSDLLNYYWNNTLGDIYLELETPKLAIDHYEAALKATKIRGYVKTTTENLEKAREQAK